MNTNEPDYYEILQVSPGAEQEVIEAAYRRLARKYHPDVNSDPSAPGRMKQLNAAFAVLGDPTRRAAYDSHRNYSPPSPDEHASSDEDQNRADIENDDEEEGEPYTTPYTPSRPSARPPKSTPTWVVVLGGLMGIFVGLPMLYLIFIDPRAGSSSPQPIVSPDACQADVTSSINVETFVAPQGVTQTTWNAFITRFTNDFLNACHAAGSPALINAENLCTSAALDGEVLGLPSFYLQCVASIKGPSDWAANYNEKSFFTACEQTNSPAQCTCELRYMEARLLPEWIPDPQYGTYTNEVLGAAINGCR